MHDWYYGPGWGWFGALMMVVTMVLFWGGLITVLVLALRRFGHGTPAGNRDAHTILDERYARGEIDDEELHRRREALRRGGQH